MRDGVRLGALGFATAFLALLLAPDRAWAGPGAGIAPPDYPQIGLPDPAAAQSLLDQFRQAGFATGDYFLRFDLLDRPRHGDEHVFPGSLWGGRNDQGMILRIVVADASGAQHRLLLQNGPRSAAWSLVAGQAARLEGRSLLAPLVAGVELTAFDLQMPYLYWPDARVTNLNRIRGRPAYAFLFRPPADFAAAHPEIGAVRAFLDTEFDRPLQVEMISRDGAVLKTLSIVDLKKIDGQWMLDQFDVRNEATRDYTRFTLTAVALGIDLPPSLLTPGGLAGEPPPPPAGRTIEIGP